MAEASSVPVATIVTQTRTRTGREQQFALWQEEVGRVVATQPGFIDQRVMPPSPPAQVDWVILQRFSTSDHAVAWLRSDTRLKLLNAAQDLLAGGDDIHLVTDSGGVMPAPASVVISTRVKPGHESDYRRWEQRIAAAQARAPGYQGYRIEPPVPGVQEDWLAIVRFDSEANLQNWLNSETRAALLRETPAFIETFNARVVRTGFDQWFPAAPGGAPRPPAWKQNMIVILLLYPVVFLFGDFVQRPLLMERAGLPFWLSLFIGNVVSVILLNYLVPLTSARFAWWLEPESRPAARINVLGAVLIAALYAFCLIVFSQL